jgi:DNA repair protein RadC
MKKSFTVHDLPAQDRPRERLQRFGIEALSTPEIIALILGRGTAGESVMVTAQRLLSERGDLKGIAAANVDELMQIRGIGLAKAAQLIAAFELARRADRNVEIGVKVSARNPEDIADFIKNTLKGKKKEHFIALLLDTRNRLKKVTEVSIGSLDTSIAHPREVFKEAIAASASSIIIAHNHPSGDCTPSSDDIELTKRLVKAGEIIDITVLDHIIVSDTGYLSLKAKGLF